MRFDGMHERQNATTAEPAFDLPPCGAPKEQSYVLLGRQYLEGPLKWVVLDSADTFGEGVLLISEKVLDFCCYTNGSDEEIEYKMSELEDRIGNGLIYELFSSDERKYFSSPPRPAAAEEVETHFKTDDERIAYPTAYSLSKRGDVELGSFGSAPYWTTSPGELGRNAFVQPDGDLNRFGCLFDEMLGIRLVVQLKIDPRTPPWNSPFLHESIYNYPCPY